MVRAVLVLAVLAGCGRKGFEGADADLSMTPDGQVGVDGEPVTCVADDGVCLVACVGSDSDCDTTCGDGTCVGNAGELCNSCQSDCMTTNVVCGNGSCESGEPAGGCYADCGPEPWMWNAQEEQLAGLINSTRTGGYRCPGMGGPPVTRPALTIQPGMKAAAREWVWEIAHQNYWMADGSSCNGRTYSQRGVVGGFTDYISSYGFADVQTAFNDWLAAQTTCNLVMSDLFTEMNVAVADDLQQGYIFVIK